MKMTILCKGRLLDLSNPIVMGILNLTPDSFFDGGQYTHVDAILRQAEKMLQEGASLLDLGGASSRQGAAEVPEAEEMRRVLPAVAGILQRFPEAILSIDTWRASVAEAAIDAGAHIINDISGGALDANMFATAGKLQAPYILMHMQGTPQTMQQQPHYEDVVTEVLDYFIEKTARLRASGVKDIVLDPGFGFGKTVEHNYTLLKHLHVFESVLGLPVLAGLSRKSMICKPLGISPENALNGTTAVHMVALQQGARILRVHDVREAMEVIRLWPLVKA
ncbi:MAG: dihydropteroate synthase [Saprospiraceae bacterium]|nr:dihydropteroate synthase [Saprospiraceae bacterium]